MQSNRTMPIQEQRITLKNYLYIAKPGIVLGNLLATLGGFLLASRGQINILLLFATLLGAGFVMASGCVYNNSIDRDLDKLMSRTKERVLAKGEMIMPLVWIYGTLLGAAGIIILFMQTTIAALACAIAGWLIYVVAYSLYFKRHSIHGTVVGSFSGALPPVIGYCAVTGRIDFAAVILFAILSLWQIPHFYAISIFRKKDYANAQIPVPCIILGNYATKWQMTTYMVFFIIVAALLTVFSYTGYIYLTIVLVMGGGWLFLCIKGFTTEDDGAWAKKIFVFSIAVIAMLSVAMGIDFV